MKKSTDALWEGFAQQDAEGYILTEQTASGSADRLDSFFAAGVADAAAIVEAARPWIGSFGTAVDIGCGVGRLAIPMASSFRNVYAIDVSPTMLVKLAANTAERGVDNVHPLDAADLTLGGLSADLVYSHIVFQHIDRFSAIRRYLALTRSWLTDVGVASLQFDTRPQSVGYRLRSRVPDPLLPRHHRRGIRRIRRAREDLLQAFADEGLDVVAELNPNSAAHVFLAVAEKPG